MIAWIVSAAKWLWNPVRRMWTLIGAGLIAVLLLWAYVSHLRSEAAEKAQEAREAQAASKVLTKARAADNAVISKNRAQRDALQATESVNSAETEAALEANADWANQPVPYDVLGSLRK